MIANWAPSQAYSVGAIVSSIVNRGTGFFFRCTQGGTSGATEPVWPTTITNTVEDGTVVWTAVSIVAGEFQTLAPSSIIEMFRLDINALQHGLDESYYFHAGSNMNGNGDLVWAGQAYTRFPLEADGFEYNGI